MVWQNKYPIRDKASHLVMFLWSLLTQCCPFFRHKLEGIKLSILQILSHLSFDWLPLWWCSSIPYISWWYSPIPSISWWSDVIKTFLPWVHHAVHLLYLASYKRLLISDLLLDYHVNSLIPSMHNFSFFFHWLESYVCRRTLALWN